MKVPLMFCSTEEESDNLNQGVDEVSHNDTRRDDFCVRVLLLVEVPRTPHTEELAIVPCAV